MPIYYPQTDTFVVGGISLHSEAEQTRTELNTREAAKAPLVQVNKPHTHASQRLS